MALIKVKSGDYDFFINGRRIFIRDAKGINGASYFMTHDNVELSDMEYARIVDDIYRRRIYDTKTLMTRVYSLYKLVPTSRKLK